jgi:AcrR family transcriptional regulator
VSLSVLAAARRLAERGELAGASMADIANEAGITRVTLYRRGETRPAILAALRDELVREERELILPLLAADGDARTRLEKVFQAVCAMTDARADLLTGLDDATLNALYHAGGEESRTRPEFIAPILRLLRDGVLDGSLRALPDPERTATVLYTQISYTYLHLRSEHGWTAEETTAAVVDMAISALRP